MSNGDYHSSIGRVQSLRCVELKLKGAPPLGWTAALIQLVANRSHSAA